MPNVRDVIDTKLSASKETLEHLLHRIAETTDTEEARAIGREFLEHCVMQKHTPKKLEALSHMDTATKIYSLCFNTMLSGEGLKVIKCH